jgi:hypothetical protein
MAAKKHGEMPKSKIWISVLAAALALEGVALLINRYVLQPAKTEETDPKRELLATVPVGYAFNDGTTVEYEEEQSIWFTPCGSAREDTIRIYRLHNLYLERPNFRY